MLGHRVGRIQGNHGAGHPPADRPATADGIGLVLAPDVLARLSRTDQAVGALVASLIAQAFEPDRT